MSLSPSTASPKTPRNLQSAMSPYSPTSPTSTSIFDSTVKVNEDDSMIHVLKSRGFSHLEKITDTLQGSLYRACLINKRKRTKRKVVVKITDKYLHSNSLSRIIDGYRYRVNEDILLEKSIIQYVTEQPDCPRTIVKFHRFFSTATDYCLVMQDGGDSLYKFVIKAHRLLKAGKIVMSHWKEVVRVIFEQLTEAISYLHSLNIVHFDISLENLLINDVQIKIRPADDGSKTEHDEHNSNSNSNGKKKGRGAGKETVWFVLEDIRIRLCDFGMAQLFTSSNCQSSKYRGKTNYKSPEIMSKKRSFCGKSNDIWCMGICLFMLSAGFPPFHSANKDDRAFQHVMNGELMDLLKAWRVVNYFDKHLFSLLDGIFQYETHRITLDAITKHAYLHE